MNITLSLRLAMWTRLSALWGVHAGTKIQETVVLVLAKQLPFQPGPFQKSALGPMGLTRVTVKCSAVLTSSGHRKVTSSLFPN